MIRRLIEFYERYGEAAQATMSPIWTEVLVKYQTPMLTALKAKDEAGLKLCLDGAFQNKGLYGMDWGEYEDLMLPRIARRLGILPIENPEQPIPVRFCDLKELKAQVVEAIGTDLKVPRCFGYTHEVPARFYFYLGAMHTIRDRFPDFQYEGVLEIGAGLCSLGLLCRNMDFPSYSVIDLPSSIVLGAYFLSHCVAQESIWMEGEGQQDSHFAKFYPSSNFSGAMEHSYDLIFNMDSFPEIPVAIQDRYVNLICECLSDDGIFHSVNHESNNCGQRRVREAIGNRLECIYRAPFIMRPGYVEEIYQNA